VRVALLGAKGWSWAFGSEEGTAPVALLRTTPEWGWAFISKGVTTRVVLLRAPGWSWAFGPEGGRSVALLRDAT